MLLMDRFGYVKSIDISTYERNREAADAEFRQIIPCMSDDRICLFTNTGQMHLVKMADVPFGKFRDKGIPVDNICNYSSSSEEIVAILCLADIMDKKLLFVTRTSMIKLVEGAEFDVSKRTTAATKLAEGDQVLCVGAAAPEDTLALQSEKNYFLRIQVSDIPEKKKGAIGVRGMRLGKEEGIVSAWILKEDSEYAVKVKDKEVVLNRLHVGNRDTRGVKR